MSFEATALPPCEWYTPQHLTGNILLMIGLVHYRRFEYTAGKAITGYLNIVKNESLQWTV